MRQKINAHFFDPVKQKRLIVTDVLKSGKVEYLCKIWMIPSQWTNDEVVRHFSK